MITYLATVSDVCYDSQCILPVQFGGEPMYPLQQVGTTIYTNLLKVEREEVDWYLCNYKNNDTPILKLLKNK